jgi:hypothetical protein
MPKSRLDLEQLDEFKDVLGTIVDLDLIRWNDTIKKFVPISQADVVNSDLHFRRIMLLMGG